MSSTLALATRLSTLSGERLAETIRARAVPPAGIRDFFDLADAFLEPGSIRQALTRLNRHSLAALVALAEITEDAGRRSATPAEVAEHLATASGAANATSTGSVVPGISIADATAVTAQLTPAVVLMLLEHDAGKLMLYDEVAEQVATRSEKQLPGLVELLTGWPPGSDNSPDRDRPTADHAAAERLSAEQAFIATTAVDHLLIEIEREPAALLVKGTVSQPDLKRLTAAMTVALDSVPVYLRIAERAGLLRRESGLWLITEEGQRWLLASAPQRWRTLAASWRKDLPPDIHSSLVSLRRSPWDAATVDEHLDWLYPAGSGWVTEQVAAHLDEAQLLGITADDLVSKLGQLLLDEATDAAERMLAAQFPPEVDQVYLQRDLTVIAPGPLKPPIDARLRLMADVENRALASSYRISTPSINRAFAAGETAASLLGFLNDVSLTGIPQPLEYLIVETAERYGLLRVGLLRPEPTTEGARSYLRDTGQHLLAAVLVDQNLAYLDLSARDRTTAVSRYEPEVLFWALSDARYPVAAEDENGQPVTLHRQRTARTSRPAIEDDPAVALAERLRLGVGAGPQSGQAWLVRQLEVAVRRKIALTVSITLPNGTLVDYQLEPISVSGGRLRCLDRNSAIERTLPLANISRLRPAE